VILPKRFFIIKEIGKSIMPKTPHQHKRNKPTCPSLKSEARTKKEEIRHKTTPLPNFTIHSSPFNAPRGGVFPSAKPLKKPPIFPPSCLRAFV
jgi:hypothetical protein